MAGTPAISVVIPVRNEGDRVVRTVQSIVSGRSCFIPVQIVLVDDASDDDACERVRAVVADAPWVSLTLRRLETWSGIPYARNRGAEIAQHPVLLITDGNTVFPANWDTTIWPRLAPGRLLAATIIDGASPFRGFGCQLMLPSMSVTWIPTPNAYGGYTPISACTGTVVERSVFLALGGYDESLSLYGAAEPEFSLRAWLSGFEVVGVPELCISHRFRPPAEHDAFLESIAAQQMHNYLRFACYYLPSALLGQTCEHWERRDPTTFSQVWANLYTSDVWTHRARLRHLPRNFDWFAARFPLGYESVGGSRHCSME